MWRRLWHRPRHTESRAAASGSSRRTILPHQHDGANPECSTLTGGIENSDLALIFTGRKIAQVDAEAEGHHAQPAAGLRRYGSGRRFKGLLLAPVETHKSDQRRGGLSGCCAGSARRRPTSIGLKVDVHLAARVEHACNTRNQFDPTIDQWIARNILGFVFTAGHVVERVFHVDALTAEDHGA